MKLLTTLTLFSILAGCTGCESTPPAVKIPALPAKEAPAKFKIGDLVSATNGTQTIEGVILEIGPMGEWENNTTGEKRISRAYRVQVIVDGKAQRGILPEFALTLR